MTIAVDFDGCLCKNKWPEIGKENTGLILWLRRRQRMGDKVILWTCREGDLLDEAVLWCLRHGLKFDAVNDNLREDIEKYGNNCRKVNADVYLDDKNSVVIEVDQNGYVTVLFSNKTIYDEYTGDTRTGFCIHGVGGSVWSDAGKKESGIKRPGGIMGRLMKWMFGEDWP